LFWQPTEAISNALHSSLQLQLTQAQQMESSLRVQLTTLQTQMRQHVADITQVSVEAAKVKAMLETEMNKRKATEDQLRLLKEDVDETTAKASKLDLINVLFLLYYYYYYYYYCNF
jgi:D-hexose-6-phosphate mutarotase